MTDLVYGQAVVVVIVLIFQNLKCSTKIDDSPSIRCYSIKDEDNKMNCRTNYLAMFN